MAETHGTVKVLITSIDGNTTHVFRLLQTIDDVRKFGYDRLVQDKSQIPLSNTWIEQSGTRLDNTIELSTLVTKNKHEPELTLTLAWTQQGGH